MGPLLQAVSKGRPPGSPRLQRSPVVMVAALVLVATAGLLLVRLASSGSSDASGGAAGESCRRSVGACAATCSICMCMATLPC